MQRNTNRDADQRGNIGGRRTPARHERSKAADHHSCRRPRKIDPGVTGGRHAPTPSRMTAYGRPAHVGTGLVGCSTRRCRSRAPAAAPSAPTKGFEISGGAHCRLPQLGTLAERKTPQNRSLWGVGVGADSRHIWSKSVFGFWTKTAWGFDLQKVQPKVFLAQRSAIINKEVISFLRIRQYSITGRCGLVAKPIPLPRGRQTSLVSLSLLTRPFGALVPPSAGISASVLTFGQPFDAYSDHAFTPIFLPLRAKQLPRTCQGSRKYRSFNG